jgi:hypothetical protein
LRCRETIWLAPNVGNPSRDNALVHSWTHGVNGPFGLRPIATKVWSLDSLDKGLSQKNMGENAAFI